MVDSPLADNHNLSCPNDGTDGDRHLAFADRTGSSGLWFGTGQTHHRHRNNSSHGFENTWTVDPHDFGNHPKTVLADFDRTNGADPPHIEVLDWGEEIQWG